MHAHAGYYAERMWIPFALLRTEIIRKARQDGLSFMNERPFIDLPNHPRLARLLGYRYRIRGLRRWRLPVPRSFGTHRLMPADSPANSRPSFVEFDTGALLHLALKRKGQSFAALPDSAWGDVRHYHGVTRAEISTAFRRSLKAIRLATTDSESSQASVMADVKARLADVYDVRAP